METKSASGVGVMERKEKRTMKRNLLASLIVIASLLVLSSGCQWLNDTTSPEPVETTEVIDLDSPTGGFTVLDEEPAFGEDELYEPMLNEIAVDDTTADCDSVKSLTRNRHALHFRLRALWGNLSLTYGDAVTAESEYCPLDWSGGMHIDGGAIVIERLIAFECDDSITRENLSTISWVSNTGPHVDGIQVSLVVPWGPADSTETYVEPKLTIETGPYSRTFTMEELKELNLIEPVDDCGNGISIASQVLPAFCPRGFLAGVWKNVPPDTIPPADTTDTEKIVLGKFRGIWISERGGPGGYLRGVFGKNSDGERVFFGKYIDMTGRFVGILKGYYGQSPVLAADTVNPYGFFQGVWINKDLMLAGRLKGHWISDEPGSGFFHGIWGADCTEEEDQ
jgi:hypothetical protein